MEKRKEKKLKSSISILSLGVKCLPPLVSNKYPSDVAEPREDVLPDAVFGRRHLLILGVIMLTNSLVFINIKEDKYS